MENPRSAPAPDANSSQGSGEAFAAASGGGDISAETDKGKQQKKNRASPALKFSGRDVTGVERTSAWTGKFQCAPTSGDLVMTAPDDSDEMSDKITHVIEQRLGHIEGLDWNDDMLREEIDSHFKRYLALPDGDDDEAWAFCDDQQLQEMEIRFAICRIKYHEMLKGVVLSDTELREKYPLTTFEENGYFEWLECDFEWHFDPEYCKFANLEDYQRITLRDTGEYLHWEYYHKTRSTLKSDQEFVQYWEKLSSKTEWIKDFLGDKSSVGERIRRVAFYHSVKIAQECTNMFTTLLRAGYTEYLWSVGFDSTWCRDFAFLYFEIWKLVARQKMNFKDALDQVKDKAMLSLCRFEMKSELSPVQNWLPGGPITCHYRTYVAEIDENLTDDEAYKLVMDAVKKFVPKLKSYYDYAKKKLDIAEKIGLITPSPNKSET